MLRGEQVRQQVERFGGNEFAAHLVTGKASAFEQQYASATAGARDGRRSSRRAASNYDQVV